MQALPDGAPAVAVMARPRHSRGDIEKVLKAAEKAGCRITGGGRKHYAIWLPDGASVVYVSGSPSRGPVAEKTRRALEKRGVALE